MARLTGRSRTVRYDGTIVLTTGVTVSCGTLEPLYDYDVIHSTAGHTGYLEIQCEGFEVVATTFFSFKNNLDPCAADDGERDAVNTLDVSYGGYPLYSDEYVKVEEPSLGRIDGDAGGSFYLTGHAVEWEEVYVPDDVLETIYGSPWPTRGGAAVADGIPLVAMRRYEVWDSDLSFHVESGTLSFDYAVTPPTGTGPGYQIYGDARVAGSNEAATTSSAWTFNSLSMAGGPYSVSDSAGASATASSGVSATIASMGEGVAVRSRCVATIGPETKFRVKGRLRAQDQPYPDSLPLIIEHKAGQTHSLTLSPTGTYDWDQHWFEAYAVLNDVTQVGLSELDRAPVSTYLSGLSGEDAKDWRTQFSGYKWNAATLAWADRTLPSSALSGDTSYTIALAGDDRQALPRFLRLAGLQTDSDREVSVSLAGRVWKVDATATAATVDVDLARATDETETQRYKDTRFELDPDDTVGFPTAGKPVEKYALGWGVEWADGIDLSVTGGSLSLSSASYVSTVRKRFTLLAPFAYLTAGWTSDTDVTTLQRYGLLEVDGRVIDWPHAALVTPTTGGDPYWRLYTIAEFVGMLGYGPNWSCALEPDDADGYHTSGLPALLLGGGGATVDHATGVWTDWYDHLPTTVPAQDLWDYVDIFPGAGDVFTNGDFDTRTTLYVSKSLRFQGTGLLFDSSGVRESGATGELRRVSDNALRGTGSSDALGYYSTGTPWGVGSTTHKLQRPGGTGPTFSVANRMRHRAALAFGIEPGDALGMDVSRNGRWARAFRRGTDLWIGITGNFQLGTWDDRDTGIAADWARCRFRKVGLSEPLYVLLGSSGSLSLYRLDTEGGAPTLSETIGSGDSGDLWSLAEGVLATWRKDSGAVYVRRFRADETEIGTEQATNLTGLDDDTAIAVASYPDPQTRKRRIGLLHTVGGALLVRLSDNGITFDA